MKKSRRCPKCSSIKIGVLAGVSDDVTISVGADLADLGVPAGTVATTGSDLDRTAYICADCGYYETYVSQPHAVNFDEIAGQFTWLNQSGSDPYR